MRGAHGVAIVLVVVICILTTGGRGSGDLGAWKKPRRTSSLAMLSVRAASSSFRCLRVLVAPSSDADSFRDCVRIYHSQGWSKGIPLGDWLCCRMALVRPSIGAGGVTRTESFRGSTSCSSRFLSKGSSVHLTRRPDVYWGPWRRGCDMRARNVMLSKVESGGTGGGALTELPLEGQSPDHGAPRWRHKAVIIPG